MRCERESLRWWTTSIRAPPLGGAQQTRLTRRNASIAYTARAGDLDEPDTARPVGPAGPRRARGRGARGQAAGGGVDARVSRRAAGPRGAGRRAARRARPGLGGRLRRDAAPDRRLGPRLG